MFLSLLPYLLFLILQDETIIWRIGNLAIVLVMGTNIYLHITSGGLARGMVLSNFLFSIAFFILAVNLAGIFDLLESSTAYLVAISFQLLVSAYNFSQLILEASPAESITEESENDA